ncbi:hypothetical protein [Marisediminicola sp. LYQ134]|uniref:hypothetical protein n=1 Tax=unclassified Marisediminicola TaxID=2618316 RepID=UPI003983BD9C
MTALLGLYLVVVAQLAVRLLIVDEPVSRGIGVALLVLPLLGAWALVAEILFGIRSQRLGSLVDAEGDIPAADVPRRPSGRPVRSAAEAEFPRYKAAVEAAPDDWMTWFRLGLSYDACGDRRRARGAIRRAIAVERSSR